MEKVDFFLTDMDYAVGQKYIGIGCYRTQRGPGIILHLSLIYINSLDMKLVEEVFCLILDRELVIPKN